MNSPGLLRLRFTRGRTKYDLLEILQDGCEPRRIDCPKQGIIPHDMVHVAVESTVAARGFLGRVSEGDSAGFRMEPQAESDAVERLVEVLQGDAWSGGNSAPADILSLYGVTCEARGCPALPIDEVTVLAVRESIARLSAAWAEVPIGGSLELSFAGAACGSAIFPST